MFYCLSNKLSKFEILFFEKDDWCSSTFGHTWDCSIGYSFVRLIDWVTGCAKEFNWLLIFLHWNSNVDEFHPVPDQNWWLRIDEVHQYGRGLLRDERAQENSLSLVGEGERGPPVIKSRWLVRRPCLPKIQLRLFPHGRTKQTTTSLAFNPSRDFARGRQQSQSDACSPLCTLDCVTFFPSFYDSVNTLLFVVFLSLQVCARVSEIAEVFARKWRLGLRRHSMVNTVCCLALAASFELDLACSRWYQWG